ncbi:MAG: HepT-like ribonuclease domain-containing protein [Candidatus Binatia bacterium]
MKGDRLYLQHILDAIKKVEEYVSVSYQTFMTSSHWQDAVIRQLEIIGEATQRLSTQLCSKHADIPWSRIAELRDVLIHAYMGVDIRRFGRYTQQNLPVLKTRIEMILTNLDNI